MSVIFHFPISFCSRESLGCSWGLESSFFKQTILAKTHSKNANKKKQNATAGKKQNEVASRNDENENCENKAAGFIAARLGRFFAFMIEICDDADKISHAAPLASFSDMLAEKYLWPQSDEDDEVRWEEHFYDDELFYSLYFYSRAVLDATGVDFAPFKSE